MGDVCCFGERNGQFGPFAHEILTNLWSNGPSREIGSVMESSKPRILFVEDEQNLLNSMSFILEREGFVVAKAATGEIALQRVPDFQPDLILLDLNLPGMDGFELVEELARFCPPHCPAIIVMTGRDAEDDMIRGLERFADDYIVKPVQPRILIARIHSVLRRIEQRPTTAGSENSVFEISSAAHEIRLEGIPINLTKSEFGILEMLLRSPGKVLTREQIINAIRGIDCYVTERIVDFQICRIRKKLKGYGECIETVRGVGYKFRGDGG